MFTSFRLTRRKNEIGTISYRPDFAITKISPMGLGLKANFVSIDIVLAIDVWKYQILMWQVRKWEQSAIVCKVKEAKIEKWLFGNWHWLLCDAFDTIYKACECFQWMWGVLTVFQYKFKIHISSIFALRFFYRI